MLNEAEVRAVRGYFFEFFCSMLKYFPQGIIESVWEKKNRLRQPRLLEIDPVKLFNYEKFLNLYFNSGVDVDRESWSFLRYFTSMPLFKHLVERIVLEKDDMDLRVFEQRLIENQYNHNANGPSSVK